MKNRLFVRVLPKLFGTHLNGHTPELSLVDYYRQFATNTSPCLVTHQDWTEEELFNLCLGSLSRIKSGVFK